ncbi:MAG: hypothetical protein AAGE94_06560 [Acidobacteriota bacterium]
MGALPFRQRSAEARRPVGTRPPCVLVLVGWLIAASSGLADEPLKLRRSWHAMQTPHFVVLGDASKQQMQTVAESMESLRAFLGQLVRDVGPDPMPTYIYAFRNRHSFEPYAPRLDGEPSGILGTFATRPHAHYIALDASVPTALAGTPQHHYVRTFIRHRLPSVPMWFRIGLAELYSTFEADGDHAFVGRTIDRHVDWLQSEPMLPLFDFLSISEWAPEYVDDEDRVGALYAQSWLLVHYLFHEAEDGVSKLIRFFEWQGELSRAEAFRRAFGTTPDALEQELRRYVRSRRLDVRRVAAPTDDLDEQLSMRTMSRAEALARLGEMLAMQAAPRVEEAEAHVRAALAEEPDLAAGHVALGLLRLDAGGTTDDEAVDHFQKARALDRADPVIAFLVALGRARRGDAGAAFRDDLLRVVQADPRHVNAWRLLAWAWADGSAPLDGTVQVFEGAHKMMPDEMLYADHLVRLYRAAGRTEDARTLIASFFEPRNIEPLQASEPLPRPGPPTLPLPPF